MAMKSTSRPAPEATDPDRSVASPAEFIRMKLDAGFAAVQTGKMRSQAGSSEAASDMRDYVEKTVAAVRDAIRSAEFTESQLTVMNKKIQALRDAAARIGGS
jgi:TolA-binding protein